MGWSRCDVGDGAGGNYEHAGPLGARLIYSKKYELFKLEYEIVCQISIRFIGFQFRNEVDIFKYKISMLKRLITSKLFIRLMCYDVMVY